jgi:chemotaxis methyl-accepting protein methylase
VTDAALDHAAELLARRIGLRVDGSMRGRLARALRDEAATRGIAPAEHAGALARSPADIQRLVDHVTVQETSFFRDPAHFDVLARRALPRREPGLIWSAGCANGQEAWSLAIALEEAGADGWRVLATDVSQEAVARTREGAYTERELTGLSEVRRALYLRRRDDGRWEAGARLRARVHARTHNLVDDPPPVAAAVVFCRNVLIYLDGAARARALAALHTALPRDGWLFVGASEALTGGPFKPQRVDGTYAYRPRRLHAQPAAPDAAELAAGAHDAARRASATARRAAAGDRGPPAAEPRARVRRAAREGRAPAAEPQPGAPDAAGAAAEAAAGEAHAAAGRFGDAAAAFRRAAALAPGDPVAHLRLGLALERAGEPRAAARAFRTARAALGGADAPDLGGWAPAELARLLDEKLGR